MIKGLMMKVLASITALLWAFFPATTSGKIKWQELEEGLELAVIDAPEKSSHGDSKFTVIKIDPKFQEIHLLMASEVGGVKRTAPLWAKQYKLSVVVNAGMFQAYGDQLTAKYFMKNYKHKNSSKIANQNAFLAFNPKDSSFPKVQIIDQRCQKFNVLRKKYHTIIQGIRMVDCRQKNTWSLQPKKWSMVVVAMDKGGKVLFIFTRSPYRVNDFVKMLLDLPLRIKNMMYLEGGPEASLYVSAGGVRVGKYGSYETGFYEKDDNNQFWPIPNVLGIKRHKH